MKNRSLHCESLACGLLTGILSLGFLGIFETTEIREKACVHVLLTGERFHGIHWSLKET